jgi:tRNA A-37 threonylcarbamoyl transferase component Bud32
MSNPADGKPSDSSQRDIPTRHLGGAAVSRAALDELVDEVLQGGAEAPAPSFPGFTILEKLGQGAFGAVYRARDEKLEREVALKVLLDPSLNRPAALDSGGLARFLDEARALARVRHPGVLTIHSVVEQDGRAALVLELIRGQPLDAIVEERGPFSAGEAARIGAEACRALAAVHAAGIVHRDVKTANLLREEGGRIVLADFGLGAVLAAGRPLAEDARIAGSPLFMSPEHIAGAPPGPAMDLYSLGVVLYHLSSGRFPVTARSLGELLQKVRDSSLTPLRDARPDLPDDFVRVVTRALDRDPARRFASAGELEAALLACGGAAPALPAPPALPATRFPWGPGWLAAAAAVAALAALCVALWRGGGEAPPFRVRAVPLRGGVPLADGEAVRVGDGLSLELEADRPVHVYVVNEDAAGEVHVLFPLPGAALKNPLPGGRVHRLPGAVDGEAVEWQVSSAGGTESICAIAAAAPLPALEEALVAGRVTAEVVLRGIGGLKRLAEAPRAAKNPISNAVAELARQAATSEAARGLWVRKITLRNP